MIRWLKNNIKYILLKKRFPASKIYVGAEIDENSRLGNDSVVFSNTIMVNSIMGNYSYIQKNSEIVNTKIGKFCSIANNVHIGLPNHPMHMISTSPVFYDNTQPLPFFFVDKKLSKDDIKQTVICDDVWIGCGAIIKSEVNIGVGAIIGAGSVVTKDVEPYSVVAGVPTKHIKYRFDENIREKLIASKWWDLDDDKLLDLNNFFETPEIFLEKLKELNEI